MKGPGKIMNALEKFGVITAEKIPPISNNKPVVTNNMGNLLLLLSFYYAYLSNNCKGIK